MILEYEKKQSIAVENGCEHIVNGVVRFDDLIRTDYIPTPVYLRESQTLVPLRIFLQPPHEIHRAFY